MSGDESKNNKQFDYNLVELEDIFDSAVIKSKKYFVLLAIHYITRIRKNHSANLDEINIILKELTKKLSKDEIRIYKNRLVKEDLVNERNPGEFRVSSDGRIKIKEEILPKENKGSEDRIKQKPKSITYQIDYKEEHLKPLVSAKNLIERYQKDLEKIWKKSPYDKSIFIMMPFKFSEVIYKQIRDAIKKAAEDMGFQAYLSNDKGRKIRPGLWENLVVNMLSCKYGIAVLTSEEILDPLDKHKLKVFNNANVALEYGFMYVKGENDVLLLAPKDGKLPVDVRGLLREQFNIKDPYDDVYIIVKKWLPEK